MTDVADLTGPTTELLQALIRNECVNDGTPDSGDEVRNAELLETYLAAPGLASQRFASRPGRGSLVARIEGTDPTAPTLCLMGHTDVVPVNPAGWSRDPFGGELIDGEVWGRGAIDMLNMTASMAVAFRQLSRSGWRPKGTLIYFGVADEEAGGTWGAEWMCDNHWDAIKSDFVLTEIGGWSSVGDDNVRRVVVNTGEKGIAWRRLVVSGTPSHGSMPFGADNALVKAAEVVRRLAQYRPGAYIGEAWRARVASMPIERRHEGSAARPGAHLVDHRDAAAGAGAHLPRGDPHDLLAERRPRRSEDQHHPRPGRDRGRHPHRARHHAGRRRCAPARGVGRAGSSRRDRAAAAERRHRVAARQRAVGCGGQRDAGRLPGCRADARG